MESQSECSDAQLVTSILHCSESAFAEVYRRHGVAVYRLARGVLNSSVEAEDVAQDVFLRLWDDPYRFDTTRGSLRSFLLAQAHGRAIDAVRSLNARHRREAQEAPRTAASSYDLEHEVADLIVEDRLSEALEKLPGEERRAIELAYLRGYTYLEVAKYLGQPEGTVKSRIRSGMQRMRLVLSEFGASGVDA
jgi:RNA polymerase sigma-70 factor (ECF subfamily)